MAEKRGASGAQMKGLLRKWTDTCEGIDHDGAERLSGNFDLVNGIADGIFDPETVERLKQMRRCTWRIRRESTEMLDGCKRRAAPGRPDLHAYIDKESKALEGTEVVLELIRYHPEPSLDGNTPRDLWYGVRERRPSIERGDLLDWTMLWCHHREGVMHTLEELNNLFPEHVVIIPSSYAGQAAIWRADREWRPTILKTAEVQMRYHDLVPGMILVRHSAEHKTPA